MNWYLIVAVVSAFLLGWSIGIMIGTTKGYAIAIQEQAEQTARELWANYISQLKGEKDEK